MTYRLSEKTPGIFSMTQIEELQIFISKKTKEIKTSNSPRLIILETWFIVDWFIRQFIISGINCFDLMSDNFKPHYQLLPNSFRECIDVLIDLIESQKKMEPKPRLDTGLKGSLELWDFIKQQSPDTFNKIHDLTDEFQREKYKIPQDVNYIIGAELNPKKKSYRFVTNEWLDGISKIDKNWISAALKINKARNNAAHSLEDDDLYDSLGIRGKNKIEKLRKECLVLLQTIIGLTEDNIN